MEVILEKELLGPWQLEKRKEDSTEFGLKTPVRLSSSSSPLLLVLVSPHACLGVVVVHQPRVADPKYLVALRKSSVHKEEKHI